MFTVENGTFVKYVPEVPEVKETNMFEMEINSFIRCIRTGESCHPISTQQLRPLILCRLFMIPQSSIGKSC